MEGSYGEGNGGEEGRPLSGCLKIRMYVSPSRSQEKGVFARERDAGFCLQERAILGKTTELQMTKKMHSVIKATVVIILAILCIFSCIVIGLYIILLYEDPAYLRTVVKNSVIAFLASLSTLGIKTVTRNYT